MILNESIVEGEALILLVATLIPDSSQPEMEIQMNQAIPEEARGRVFKLLIESTN